MKNMQINKSRKLMAFSLMALLVLTTFIVVANGENTDNSGKGKNTRFIQLSDFDDDVIEKLELDNEDEIEDIQKLKIEPKRQVSSDGEAVYEITVRDLHECEDEDDNSSNNTECENKTYTYNLGFKSLSGNPSGAFSKSSLTLKSEERETIKLTIKTETKGINTFEVSSTLEGNNENTAKVKGVLVYLTGENITKKTQDVSFFIGKGFAVNNDESNGFLVDLTILNKEGTLSGKIRIGNSNFKIDGNIESSNNSVRDIEFDLISPKTNNVVGTFSGEVKKIGTFLLLKGTIKNFESSDWKLTATSKQIEHVRVLESEEIEGKIKVKKEIVKVKEVVVIKDFKTEEEIYVRPIKIEAKKVFWIFPSGEKVVEIEVVRGNEVIKKKIKEFDNEIFEKYKISIGSLENEEELEIEVEEE